MRFVGEAFIDRAYLPSGQLVPRGRDGAVLASLHDRTRQALDIALHGQCRCQSGEVIAINAQTLCLHGDTEDADDTARHIAQALRESGVEITAL